VTTPTVEEGYADLKKRAGAAIERLKAIEVSSSSVLTADDQFFHPIYRTFSQGVVECLFSALDHLRFLAWSLDNREKPFPYAQATLIRTAITAASTALWMTSGSTDVERRSRALEFNFNDLKSHLGWMDTLAADPINQQRPAAEQAQFDALYTELERRIDWVLQEATTLQGRPNPFTRNTYGGQATTETQIVRHAGSIATAIGVGGYDSGLVLLNTWQLLSGYAHGRPWASLHGGKTIVNDPTPDPTTGQISITKQGDPDRLLDFAFRALIVTEVAVMAYEQLAR
jgi:hypothetical protein